MDLSVHRHTPTLIASDPRGLPLRTVAYYRQVTQDVAEARITHQQYDLAGRLITQRDPRLFAQWQKQRATPASQTTHHNLSGRVLYRDNSDAGWRLHLQSDTGQVLASWDGRGSHSRIDYDPLLRPVALFEQAEGGPERCREQLHYASATTEDQAHNRCGRLVRHDDSAGSLFTASYALSGQPVRQNRRFLAEPVPPGWPSAILEDESCFTTWKYDALGAMVLQTDAVGNRQSWRRDVAGQPAEHSLTLPGQAPRPLLFNHIHDAEGRLISCAAGNGVVFCSDYDHASGYLLQLLSRKANGNLLQDLRYHYDPLGHVLGIDDNTQPIRFFRNQRVEVSNLYAYDTLYQLISATGREAAICAPGLSARDPHHLINYRQNYQYDSSGNLQHLNHSGEQPWSRRLATACHSNRSLPEYNGQLPGEDELKAGFDANGNMRELQPGQPLNWDLRNQLQRINSVKRQNGNHDSEEYVYDAGGQRARKISRRQMARVEQVAEVRYLPGLEIRQSRAGSRDEVLHVVCAGNVRLLHWEQGQPDEIAADQLRISLTDQLGSSVLELDGEAVVLSHEGYYPYGGTAWWAPRSDVEGRYKTMRHAGKEKDASGLYYYGFRYYAPWLSRWINPDPAGDFDGLNLYCMLHNEPLSQTDSYGLASDKHEARELVKEHYRLHIAPGILARKERDKERALTAVAKVAGAQSAGPVLDAIESRIRSSYLTLNINASKLAGLKGGSVVNRWDNPKLSGNYVITRNQAENELFNYRYSSVAPVARHAVLWDAKGFRPQFRPIYGAIDLNSGVVPGPSEAVDVKVGGAPDYGDTALVLSEAQKEFLTLTGQDSLVIVGYRESGKISGAEQASDLLGSFDNLFPVVAYMDNWTLKNLSQATSSDNLVPQAPYIEWQSHGALKWSKFDHITASPDSSAADAAQRFAKKHHLTFRSAVFK